MFKALILSLALLAASPAFAQTAADVDAQIDSLIGPHQAFADGIDVIKAALAERDINQLAGFISYGTAIKVNGADVVISDYDDLTAKFDTLFDAKVLAAVAAQKYESLFVNADGIMFGDGELWLNGECDDDACEFPFVTIIAINNE